MGRCQKRNLILTTLVLCMLMFCSVYEADGARLLGAEKRQWLEERVQGAALTQQRLQRGPVPPSGRSPCTYIPGQGRDRCTLGHRNYAVSQHSLSPHLLHSDSSASQR
uniref:Uncharacterized protein n=1 Tax=Kalanchoe fedtschenkoi TaxID=63787 RepID=A0A7N1A5E9_KALFE